VQLESKTKDNVFVDVVISVQYQTVRDKVYSAFYAVDDLGQQMRAYVRDTVRAALCTMTLDESFEAKEEISNSLKHHLQEVMNSYGYLILNALVTDLQPNVMVRDAMNDINSSKRLKEAAYQRAEGEKILKVKQAEAIAESMYLSGVGLARQREAIMKGLKTSVCDFAEAVEGTKSKDIIDLVVLNQYFDTLGDIGNKRGTKVVYLPADSNPVRNGMLEADAATSTTALLGGYRK
jgi:regulator of protease activity HflC (stomatin/prohibitin superfamily)